MAQIQPFDATQHDPNISRGVVPAGPYLCIISATEMKQTKNGDGYYIELVRDIVDGPMKGRKLWQRINWMNPNQQATEIGRREFSNVCHAVGKLQVMDTAELHHIPHVADVKFVPARGEFGEKNEINQCKAWDGQPLPPPPGAPAQAAMPWGAQPVQVAAPAVTPWLGQQTAPAAAPAQQTAPAPAVPAKPVWAR